MSNEVVLTGAKAINLLKHPNFPEENIFGAEFFDGNIEFSSNLRDSQKDLIADEVGDLRKEVSELKEMIKLLIQNK